MEAVTRYARSGEVHIAYQVVGDGPFDLVWIPPWLSQVEHLWEEPSVARFFGRLASFARLILFDRRGSGLSDRLGRPPTLEEQMDDVRAVMRAAGSDRAALLAITEGGPVGVLLAATYPEQVGALVLHSAMASLVAADDVPWTLTPAQRRELIERTVASWGTGERVLEAAPSRAGDPAFRAWAARLERLAASPGSVRAMADLREQTDVGAVLPAIRVPALVIHRTHDRLIDVRHGRHLAAHIPGARLVELPGEDSLPSAGDADVVLDEIEEFLTGARPAREPDRVLATVMFTDIVDSTRRAAELGDRRWRDLLEEHDRVVRRELARHRGREVKTTGDGFLATFDGPARAIRCACAVHEATAPLGIVLRAGLHTGEVETIGEDLGGLAVHIGARVGALAGPGEVLVSGTVKDLVVGSELAFEDRGARELRGVPGEWRVWAVRR